MASADLFGSPFDRREEEEGDEDSGLHPADESESFGFDVGRQNSGSRD